ncbi:MAG: YiiX/YebB-like N1pC/P60 family cysteine hydrolase [Bacteroidales bacterium]|nr:YiiX/YebB-like N1pC/P60 family cysteine hydrolase [Bacteroidales bacterium]
MAFWFLIISTLCVSQENRLPHGALLFQQLDCGNFCEAINRVTPSYKGIHYNHVGVVWHTDSGIYVLEAITKGVSLTPLQTFLIRTDKDKIKVGLLPKQFKLNDQELFKYLGKPYDTVFDLNNQAYYCSELAYFLYKDKKGKNFFTLYPMTFKDPATNEFFSIWVEYFSAMKYIIPEGKLGLNPGSMMNEKRIKIIPYK